MAQIKGKEITGVLNEEANRVQAAMLKDAYESHEFTVPGGGYTDTNLVTASALAFATVVRAHTIVVRSSADMSFRFNSVSNNAIALRASEGSFSVNALEIASMFITAPAGAQIKILLI